MWGVMGEVAALDVAAAQECAVRLATSRRIFVTADRQRRPTSADPPLSLAIH
jgi:hypothetical protein